MIFSCSLRLLVTASTFIAITLPMAYAGCLPKAVVETYGLYNGCPEGPLIKVFHDSKYGYITPEGEMVVGFIYDNATELEQGMASVAIRDIESRDYLWGAINEAGEEVIAPKYENALQFSEGLALVQKDNTVGYVDRNGKLVIDFKFSRASSFDDGRAIVDYSDFHEVINAKGEVVLPSSTVSFSRLNDKLFLRYTRDQQYISDIVDINGTVYQKGVYVASIENHTQLAENEYRDVQEDIPLWYMLADDIPAYAKTYHLMNSRGDIVFQNLVMPVKQENVVSTLNGLTVVDTGSQLQVIDEQGNIVLSGDFDSIFPFNENNLAIVKKKDKLYYYQLQPINRDSFKKSDLITDNHKSINIGQLAIDQSFDKLSLFSEGLAFAKQGEWQGFIDKVGNKVREVDYHWVTPFHNGFATFLSADFKWGVMNKQGETVIAPKYNTIHHCGSHFIVKKDDLFGVLDRQGQEVVESLYTDIDCYDDFVIASYRRNIQDSFTKLIYLESSQAYPYKVDSLRPMEDGYAAVMVYKPDEHNVLQPFASVVDKAGKVTLIMQQKYNLHNIGKGLFTYNDQQKGRILVNHQGRVISQGKYDYFDPVVDGYVPVRKNGVWGVIDTEGNEVLPPIYKKLTVLGDDLFMVKKGMGLINKQGKDVVVPSYDGISFLSDGFIKVTMNSTVSKSNGVLGPNLQPILPLEYSEILYLEDDVFAVKKEGSLKALADTRGKVLTKPKYQEIKRHSKNRLSMKSQDKWGLLDDKGKQVVPPIYDEIRKEKSNRSVVMKSGKYGYIDRDGKTVTDLKFAKANSFYSDDEAYVEMDGKAYYIDIQGNILRKSPLHRAAEARREVRPD